MENPTGRLLDHVVVASGNSQGLVAMGEELMLAQGYIYGFNKAGWAISEDMMYNSVAAVNRNWFYTWNLLKEKLNILTVQKQKGDDNHVKPRVSNDLNCADYQILYFYWIFKLITLTK